MPELFGPISRNSEKPKGALKPLTTYIKLAWYAGFMVTNSKRTLFIINSAGVPFPPTNLQTTECYNRTTNLTWILGASNKYNYPVRYFLIEQESNYQPNVFRLIYNVTDPNATSVSLDLPGWSSLRFRIRAVNDFGPSRASAAKGICRTNVSGELSFKAFTIYDITTLLID